MELLAQSPQINHPSVVVAAPDGRIFVAEDPMDISAPADAKQGRIICFHPDGRRTVFAEGLHAVFGLQYLEGKVYVLHNPHFSAFADEGDRAGAREELVESTNPNPWALDWNDHVPANFKLAMDGFFYIAVGDKGLYNAKGRDGRVVNLHGGGIARIRPDGTGFEVVCTGVRNILDVALNDEDEMFTYDNTDEHNWMGRLTHMVEGGYYGYPYDFQPRRPYTLWMMADFGPGAACGAICATEGGLPTEYNNDLFLSDFGKRQIMRVKVRRAGATYEVVSKEDLFPNPPEDFRPVGIAWAANGRDILICDWQHRDVKANKQIGRLWKLTYTGPAPKVEKPEWYVPLASRRSVEAPTSQLINALDHTIRDVRLNALRALRNPRVNRWEAAKSILEAMREPNSSSRKKAHLLWALHAIDSSVANDRSREFQANADPLLRRQGLRQLALSRSARVETRVSPLAESDASVRFWDAAALARTGVDYAIQPLIQSLRDADPVVRVTAIHGINKLMRKEERNPNRAHSVPHWGTWQTAMVRELLDDSELRETIQFCIRGVYDHYFLACLEKFVLGYKFGKVEARKAALAIVSDMHHKTAEWKGEWWAYHPALAPPPKKTVAWEGTEKVKQILLKHIDSRKELAVIAIRGIGEANFQEGAEKIRTVVEKRGVDAEVRAAGIGAIVELKPAWAAEVLRKFAAEDTNAFAGLVKIGGASAEAFVKAELASADPAKSKRAILAAGQLRNKTFVEPLLAHAKQPDAVAALAQIADVRALDHYLAALDEKNITLRESVVRALRTIAKEAAPLIKQREITAEQASALREVYRNNSDMLAFINAKAPATNEPSIDEYVRAGRSGKGNTTIGQRIFENEQGVACIKCHRVAGKGGSIGPDLTTAGAQFGRDDLIESVLFPSKVIREGNQQMEIETTDDESHVGLSKGETPTEYRLLNANGQLTAIPKTKIKSARLSNTSMMPEGLHRALTPTEFEDLIAYLESLK